MRKQDVVLSGGFGTPTNSARAGFLPISLARAPIEAFESIPVYLRSTNTGRGEASDFRLYCAEHVRFTARHRSRLLEHGVKFVYVPMARQTRFRQQTEARLQELAEDPHVAASVKSEIIYEAGIELINELLSAPDLAALLPRLQKVSGAVTTLVLNDPTAFSHLFTVAHHDFYTATHMVNVATWMVPLAYALGHHAADELNQICLAGLLHDIGKIHIPPNLLNKSGRLTNDEWGLIKRHPEMGSEHLQKFDDIQPLVHAVARQHHERLDGSGYPDRLIADQIHEISKVCAVVDSFDAMTAFRPYKRGTLTAAQALNVIISETPQKYDPKVVDAWVGLLRTAGDQAPRMDESSAQGGGRRKFPRFPVDCPARVHVMDVTADGPRERSGVPVVAHNFSRSGIGLLSQWAIRPGDSLRVYLQGRGTLAKQYEGVAVRCRNYQDGWYEVGLHFAQISCPEQLPPELDAA